MDNTDCVLYHVIKCNNLYLILLDTVARRATGQPQLVLETTALAVGKAMATGAIAAVAMEAHPAAMTVLPAGTLINTGKDHRPISWTQIHYGRRTLSNAYYILI